MRRGFFSWLFFFPPSPTPFSLLIPATCVSWGSATLDPRTRRPLRTTRISAQKPLPVSTHKQMASAPTPGEFLNGVPMPVPEARVPGPSGLSWALEPRRGGEAGRGRWRNYFLT